MEPELRSILSFECMTVFATGHALDFERHTAGSE